MTNQKFTAALEQAQASLRAHDVAACAATISASITGIVLTPTQKDRWRTTGVFCWWDAVRANDQGALDVLEAAFMSQDWHVPPRKLPGAAKPVEPVADTVTGGSTTPPSPATPTPSKWMRSIHTMADGVEYLRGLYRVLDRTWRPDEKESILNRIDAIQDYMRTLCPHKECAANE